MAYDANLQLANVTGSDGATAATAIDLLTGSLRGPVMWARIEVGSATVSTSPLVLTFTIEHSNTNVDGDFKLHTSGADQTVSIPTGAAQVTAGNPIVWIPIVTDKRYIRVKPSRTGGTTTTLVYNAYITNSHPQ